MAICSYCREEFSKIGIGRHEKSCYLNPFNITFCPVCDSPIKNYRRSKTCSNACSNRFSRRGIILTNDPTNYRTICFRHHIRKCVICGEERILAVHHHDKNKKNDDPTNLVPLCPTHHAYMHSKYIGLIEKKVNKYVEEYIKKNGEINVHQ